MSFFYLQKMYSFVYLIAIGLLICGVYGRAIEEQDNAIQSDDNQYTGGRDWVKISEAPPPKIVQQIGNAVELECEVSGTPPPSVHWVRGNKPLDSVSIQKYHKNFYIIIIIIIIIGSTHIQVKLSHRLNPLFNKTFYISRLMISIRMLCLKPIQMLLSVSDHDS